MADIFPGGEPPSADELRDWLERERRVSPNVAAAIADDYSRAQRRGTGAWTEASLGDWVDDEISSFEGVTVPGPQPRPDQDPLDQIRAQRRADATAAAGERAARARTNSIPSWLADEGPSVDPEALATSLAVGVFTDQNGRIQIDPDTGQPTPVTAQTLWEAIKGHRFDMGSLSMPRQPTSLHQIEMGGRNVRNRDVEAAQRARFWTPSQAMGLLASFDSDYLTTLQQQLWEAGLFGEDVPAWGRADDATRKAFMALFAEASTSPDEPIDAVVSRLIDQRITRLAASGQGGPTDLPSFKPEVASAESLGQMIDDISQELFGRFANPDAKAALVSKLQAREVETQRAAYDRDIADISGGRGGSGELDAFMAAIAQGESGGRYDVPPNPDSGAQGKYQIMPANWGPWAERAGLGRNAPRTPENQEIVARHMMSEYYSAFGNWRDVAIAWYAGPGRVGTDPAFLNRSQGKYPSINEYADRAMERMAAARGGAYPTTTGGNAYAPIERFDPSAEAEAILKAADPVGWASNQWGEQAMEFYGLLGGVV